MDFDSLLWEETGRDIDAEHTELARTAALADASALVGPLLFQASSQEDFGHRLALAQPHLQAISSKRDYPVEALASDLARRFEILAQATVKARQKQADQRRVTAAKEAHMDAHVAELAARAARENPHVPMRECLRLATEAVTKHADAYPLAYESWGGTGDGPFTDRAKNWQPPGLKGQENRGAAAVAPGAGGDDTFDEVGRRLDDLEGRVGAPAGPAGPSGPTASLQADSAWDWSKPFRQIRDHLTDRKNPAPAGYAAAPSGHADGLMDGFDQAHSELSQKWDTAVGHAGPHPAPSSYTDGLMDDFDKYRGDLDKKWDDHSAAPGASDAYRAEHPEPDPTHNPAGYTEGLMDTFDRAKAEIGSGGGPAAHHVPGGFSHTTAPHHSPVAPSSTPSGFSDSSGGHQPIPAHGSPPGATFSDPGAPAHHHPQMTLPTDPRPTFSG